jgi:hypothetical protein
MIVDGLTLGVRTAIFAYSWPPLTRNIAAYFVILMERFGLLLNLLNNFGLIGNH